MVGRAGTSPCTTSSCPFGVGSTTSIRTTSSNVHVALGQIVLQRCEIFSRGGGFVFNPIHNIQAKTPVENIVAMVEALRLDATLAFDAPWDRFAIEDARPQPTRIDLDDLSAQWGTATFRAVGEADVDAEGFPTGEVTLRAVEWRKILDMAVASGVLPENAVGPVERALELMSGPRDTLDATITFQGGLMWLGIVPIGPAPRIVIR